MTTYEPRFDPALAHRTRIAHRALFIIGTLMLPAGGLSLLGVSLFLEGHIDGVGAVRWLLAGATCSFGILAWVALGMLFFKRADPLWHLVCWRVVALFGLFAVPATLSWLFSPMGQVESWFTLILVVTLGCGFAAANLGCRNAQRARRSLATFRDTHPGLNGGQELG